MKYRLIKRYPGLPEWASEGLVVIRHNNTFHYHAYVGSLYQMAYIFTQSQVEDYPEFWQKVTQCCEKDTDFDGNCPIHRAAKIVIHESNIPNKEYEILAYRFQNTIYTKKFNNDFTDSQTYILENFEKSEIYSIKRLSDGAIFTVGDKVNNQGNPHSWNIKKISIEKGDIRIDSRQGGVCPNFQKLEHSKKSLFTTSDGVEIFDVDRYYAVDKRSFKKISGLGVNSVGRDENNYIYFSTELAAKTYILKNKPCLSYNDVCDMYRYQGQMEFKKDLFNLIQNKPT